MNFFDHKRPRKSPPAVMSTSRETPCIVNGCHSKEFLSIWLSVPWLRKSPFYRTQCSIFHTSLYLGSLETVNTPCASVCCFLFCWYVHHYFTCFMLQWIFLSSLMWVVWTGYKWSVIFGHSSLVSQRNQKCAIVSLSLLYQVVMSFICVPQGLLLIVPSFICVGLASSPVLLYVGLLLFAICKCE